MIVVVVSFLPNSSERRGRFQTMLHFGQNQVHNMSPVLLLALSQKSHGGIIELKKKKKQKPQLLISLGIRSVRVILVSHLLPTIPCLSGFLIRLIFQRLKTRTSNRWNWVSTVWRVSLGLYGREHGLFRVN